MKAVLCLGRNGDIMNALPIAWKIFCDTGDAPGFIVQKDYADILDGASYVKPLIYNGRFQDVGKAFDQFKSEYDIHVAQVYGSSWKPRCESFCQDMWAQAGFEEDFDEVPLLFDKRDAKREEALVAKLGHERTILASFSGHSSPLQVSERLLAVLTHSWSLKVRIVNLAQIRCHRIYDLLGLYDKADLLITSDTATLHLARANVILPTIEFIVDTPSMWHGSVPTPNCKLALRYSEIIKRMTDIHSTIASVLQEADSLHPAKPVNADT